MLCYAILLLYCTILCYAVLYCTVLYRRQREENRFSTALTSTPEENSQMDSDIEQQKKADLCTFYLVDAAWLRQLPKPNRTEEFAEAEGSLLHGFHAGPAAKSVRKNWIWRSKQGSRRSAVNASVGGGREGSAVRHSLPQFQELKAMTDPVVIHKVTFSRKEAFAAAYYNEILAVSHRWETPEAPDPGGVQQTAIQEFLDHHPTVKYVWYDYW